MKYELVRFENLYLLKNILLPIFSNPKLLISPLTDSSQSWRRVKYVLLQECCIIINGTYLVLCLKHALTFALTINNDTFYAWARKHIFTTPEAMRDVTHWFSHKHALNSKCPDIYVQLMPLGNANIGVSKLSSLASHNALYDEKCFSGLEFPVCWHNCFVTCSSK